MTPDDPAKAYPGVQVVLAPQQRLENRRGVLQVEGAAELAELLRRQRARAAGVEAVEDVFQPLLVVALLLAVVHPTGQQPALEEKQKAR